MKTKTYKKDIYAFGAIALWIALCMIIYLKFGNL